MKTFMMMKSSIRKNRSSSITLVMLILLATLLLYSSLMILFQVDDVVDDVNRQNAGADYLAIVPKTQAKALKQTIDSIDLLDYYESESSISCYGTLRNKRVEKKAQNIGLNFLKLDQKRTISTITIMDQLSKKPAHPVVLPYYLKASIGYRAGDTIHTNINGIKKTFTVYGFSQNVMLSTPANIDQYQLFIEEDDFNQLKKQASSNMMTEFIRIRIKKDASSEEFDHAFVKKSSETKGIVDANLLGLDYGTMKVGTTATIQMVTMLLISFSVLMLIIALIVIRFTIINHIEEDINNIGSLEAAGFTSRMIRHALILQFIFLSAIGFVLGLAVSIIISGSITSIVSSSIGLYWISSFNPQACLIAFVVIFVFVGLIAYKTSGRIKKVTPVAALRNGLSTYNFKKNYLPLATTKGNLNLILGFKQMLHSGRQNFSIGLIGFIMSFALLMAFSIFDMFTGDDSTLNRLIGIEQSSIAVTVNNKNQIPEIEKKLNAYHEVKQTRRTKDSNVVLKTEKDEITVYANICEDYENKAVNTIYEGRYPKHKNEISLSNAIANKLGVSVGDVLTLKGKDGDKEFVVVGLNQHINHLGNSCTLTEEGMKQTDEQYYCDMFYLYLKKGINTDRFLTNLKKDLGIEELSYINMEASIEGILGSLNQLFMIISVVLAVIIVLVIGIILYYIVKVKLVRDKMIIGIQKSIGFTTKQLIVHNVISFGIVMLISFTLGAIAALILNAPLMTLMFTMVGFKKCTIDISILLIFLTILALTFVAVIMTTVVSIRIRKVDPRELLID